MTIIHKLHTLARLINANANKKSQNIHNLTANLTIYEDPNNAGRSLRLTHIGSCIQSSLTITQQDIADEGTNALTLTNKANQENREQDAIPLNAINLADTILKLGTAFRSDDTVDERSSSDASDSLASIHIGQYAGHVTIEQGNRKARLNHYTHFGQQEEGGKTSSSHSTAELHRSLASFTIDEDQLASLKQAISYRNKLATSTSEEGEWVYIRPLVSRGSDRNDTPPSSTNGYVLQVIGFDGRSVIIHEVVASLMSVGFDAFRVELKTFSDMINSYDNNIRLSIGQNSIQTSDHQLILTAPISDAEGKAGAKMDMIGALWDDAPTEGSNVVKVADVGELANAAIFASAMCDNRGDGIYIQIEKENGEYIDIEGISTDGGNNKVRMNVRVMNPQPIRKCIAPIAITNLKVWKDASATMHIGKGEKDKVGIRISQTRLIVMPMHIS